LCSYHDDGRESGLPALRMVAVVQTSLSALLNDATALEEVGGRALFSSRAPNPGARVRSRDTARALDSTPIEFRRNSRSDLRLPLPLQALGSEQAALEISLERARAIVAPRDAPYASDEDDDVLTHYQLGDVGRTVPSGVPQKYAFGTRPGPGLDTISPPKAKGAKNAAKNARNGDDGVEPKSSKEADPVFEEESVEDAFSRYDVDGSGFLDFGEASVALADMGALEGVLASKAGELFDRFDVDGDGQVDVDEFRELASKVRELRGSVNSKPAPEVPEGFAESAAAMALRKSFEAFAAFGKGQRVGEAVEHINGRDWSKLVKDCGLVGGSVNAPAADIIFARAVPKGQRVLRWEDGSFLLALAVIAAEHRVTFGQVAQRVSQCAPAVAESAEAAGAGASERAAAAAARAAAESANGPPPGADATSRAALRSIFSQYVSSGSGGKGADGKGGLGSLNALDVLHALSDVGALRRQSPETTLQFVTRAIDESLGGNAPDGSVAFDAFERCASGLVAARASTRGASYKPPEDVQMHSEQRRALRASFEAFAGGSSYGMRPEQWEQTVRACGLVGAKCTETSAAVIFAKCKNGAGSLSAAPKVLTFEGFVQACAHVAAQYDVKFDVVAQRVVKCTPKEGEEITAKKPPKSPVKPAYIPPASTKGVAGRAVAPPEVRGGTAGSESESLDERNVSEARNVERTRLSPPSPSSKEDGGGGGSRAPPSPARSTTSASSRTSNDSHSPLKPPLAAPKEIPASFREPGCDLREAFFTFADHDASGNRSPSCDAVKWGRVVRGCGLVGGSLTDDVAREIYRASGASVAEDGRMRYDEFLWACATVAGTHGVQFKEVAARVVGVAQKQRARLAEEKAKRADENSAGAGAAATKPPAADEKKKKKKGMFSRMF
jgi:hypothetical protein